MFFHQAEGWKNIEELRTKNVKNTTFWRTGTKNKNNWRKFVIFKKQKKIIFVRTRTETRNASFFCSLFLGFQWYQFVIKCKKWFENNLLKWKKLRFYFYIIMYLPLWIVMQIEDGSDGWLNASTIDNLIYLITKIRNRRLQETFEKCERCDLQMGIL